MQFNSEWTNIDADSLQMKIKTEWNIGIFVKALALKNKDFSTIKSTNIGKKALPENNIKRLISSSLGSIYGPA